MSDEAAVLWEGEFIQGFSPQPSKYRLVRYPDHRPDGRHAIQNAIGEDDDPWRDLGSVDDHLGDSKHSLRDAADVAAHLARQLRDLRAAALAVQPWLTVEVNADYDVACAECGSNPRHHNEGCKVGHLAALLEAP